MIKVFVYKQSNYPVAVVKVKKALSDFFKNEGIVSDAFVSLAFVGEKKMFSVGKKYYPKDTNLHSVFSFVEDISGNFINPKGLGINLGEIIICYPKALKEAIFENKLVDDKVIELVLHAGEHLMGRHHE